MDGLLHCVRTETDLTHRRAVERVIEAMHRRLDEKFSLDNMADVAIMSPFHLNRVFRQLTGVPPCRFLTALRLEAAKRLLVTTSLSVTDISLEVGYNSLGTFTRRFTELVGVPPSAFRAAREVPPLHRTWSSNAALGAGLVGRVEVPRSFGGMIFVGLFATPIPQSRPVACALLGGPGEFRLPIPADGVYYLASLGLEWSQDVRSYLLYEAALRWSALGRPVRISRGRANSPLVLSLRPSEPLDPPILTTPPLLAGTVRPWPDAVRTLHAH